ncbi:hypothetical protein [Endozoicomonas montiporae]|uniref:Uncharacterized protein n=1 Tax=Endozoicomonas montiporae CL-33 TaxID=570277 RepID=A0A142BAF4_9GAMM|nr:hypothetical protein [Endozoicomonas montiporae]AMO55730.1 hypothetical protein EZMO1_1567 [Endozoicomonas montiporae CL-33]
MKNAAFAFAIGLGCFSTLASAGDSYSYTCVHGRDTRVIDVIYLQRESPVPCEVRYTKKGRVKGEETLWNANYTIGFCEEKAEKFMQQQEEWGWSCKKDEPVQPAQLPEDSEMPKPVQLPEM